MGLAHRALAGFVLWDTMELRHTVVADGVKPREGQFITQSFGKRCLTVDTSIISDDPSVERAVFVGECLNQEAVGYGATWLLDEIGIMRSPLGLCLMPASGSNENRLVVVAGPCDDKSNDDDFLQFIYDDIRSQLVVSTSWSTQCLCTTERSVSAGEGARWFNNVGPDDVMPLEGWNVKGRGFFGVVLCDRSDNTINSKWDIPPLVNTRLVWPIRIAHLASGAPDFRIRVLHRSGDNQDHPYTNVSYGDTKAMYLPVGTASLELTFHGCPEANQRAISALCPVPSTEKVTLRVFKSVDHTMAVSWKTRCGLLVRSSGRGWSSKRRLLGGVQPSIRHKVLINGAPWPRCVDPSRVLGRSDDKRPQNCCPLMRVLPGFLSVHDLEVSVKSTDCFNCSSKTIWKYSSDNDSCFSTANPAGVLLLVDDAYCGEVPVEITATVTTSQILEGTTVSKVLDIGYSGMVTLLVLAPKRDHPTIEWQKDEPPWTLTSIVEKDASQPMWLALLVMFLTILGVAGLGRLYAACAKPGEASPPVPAPSSAVSPSPPATRDVSPLLAASALSQSTPSKLSFPEAGLPPAAEPGPARETSPPQLLRALADTKPGKGGRVACIDALRGLSLLVMMFVNQGGGFVRFGHSMWNGVQLADSAFPTFAFLTGTSFAIVLKAHARKQTTTVQLVLQVGRRAVSLIALGIFWDVGIFSISTVRIPGVLQYLGVAYFIVALIGTLSPRYLPDCSLNTQGWSRCRRQFGRLPSWQRLTSPFRCSEPPAHYAWFGEFLGFWPEWLGAVSLVATYLLIQRLVPVPGCPTGYIGPGGSYGDQGQYPHCTGGAHKFIDYFLWGPDHVYTGATCQPMYGCGIYDPEGTLGVLTCAFMSFLGLTAGRIVVLYDKPKDRCLHWGCWGVGLVLLALCLSGFSKNGGPIPMNKNIWSPSFVIFFAGIANLLLLAFYVLIDIFEVAQFSPLMALGMNSLAVYLMSEAFADLLPQPFPGPTRYEACANSCWFVAGMTLFAIWLKNRKIFINL
eukprot:TRINITY_DN30607_c0_g1_i1.p1 TRINITY_DN30607_c0_g1~~TRINITY_DN30607_c0_g1_i1.p1  ORF type:complete len:1019 (-),score=129.13 TRINITY_DN30607_c0_g1_i1:113-3169(-)